MSVWRARLDVEQNDLVRDPRDVDRILRNALTNALRDLAGPDVGEHVAASANAMMTGWDPGTRPTHELTAIDAAIVALTRLRVDALARSAVPIACPVCCGNRTDDGEMCASCAASVALEHLRVWVVHGDSNNFDRDDARALAGMIAVQTVERAQARTAHRDYQRDVSRPPGTVG